MARPCEARHPDPAATAGHCRLCWLATRDGRYQRLWGLPVTAPDGPFNTAPRGRGPGVRLPCDHEGAVLEWAPCGSELRHVRDCDVHDRCCRGPTNGAVKSCQGCTDYKRPPVRTRNLLFHLFPAPGRWQWHVEQLRQRQGLFNGRKIIAICTGAGLEPAETVAAALGAGWEVLTVPNDPTLREVATFEPLFSRLEISDPDEATLYAHGKSVTRSPSSTCRRWTEMLYETHFDYWPVVEDLLTRYPVAGAFYKVGKGWAESESDWHYSGSWLWFRNRDLYSRDWRRVERFWTGIEPYPSLHFAPDEAGVIFHAGKVGVTNMYDWGYVNANAEPPFAEWKMRHADRRTDYGTG